MNALDLRADHPQLLGDYTPPSTPPSKHRAVTAVAHRVAGAFRRRVLNALLTPVAQR